ncbi:Protein of unknown function [Gryllus bimaculatus]|nr:Protein of unknown function [Gryllus bimaculatus]
MSHGTTNSKKQKVSAVRLSSFPIGHVRQYALAQAMPTALVKQNRSTNRTHETSVVDRSIQEVSHGRQRWVRRLAREMVAQAVEAVVRRVWRDGGRRRRRRPRSSGGVTARDVEQALEALAPSPSATPRTPGSPTPVTEEGEQLQLQLREDEGGRVPLACCHDGKADTPLFCCLLIDFEDFWKTIVYQWAVTVLWSSYAAVAV